jgi:hypothetical protein
VEAWQHAKLSLTNRSIGFIPAFSRKGKSLMFGASPQGRQRAARSGKNVQASP